MSELNVSYPWVNKKFFAEILAKEFPNKSITVKDCTIKAALSHGENYTSQMIRATVNYCVNNQDNCEHKFIVKTALSNLELKAAVDEMGLFKKEIIVYGKILPEVQKLLIEIGDNAKLSAKCYDTNFEKSYLVFEDLSIQGYRNTDRRIGLDIDHAKLVLSKLAKFHAATAVLQTQNFPYFKELRKPNISEDSKTWKILIENGMDTITEFVRTQPEYEHLYPKIEKVKKTLFKQMCEAQIRDEEGFNVLLHGDLWCNNIMFKYKNEHPCDALMVDYQIVYWGPVSIDLSYNLFTSSNEDMRDEHWDYLLLHYHEVLKATLLKLKYAKKIPTVRDIQIELLQRGICSIVIGILLLGIRKQEGVQEDAMGKFLNDSPADRKYRLDILTNPKNKKGLDFMLNYFDRKGYFD